MYTSTHTHSIEKVSPEALLAAEYSKELFSSVLLTCSNDSGVETGGYVSVSCNHAPRNLDVTQLALRLFAGVCMCVCECV